MHHLFSYAFGSCDKANPQINSMEKSVRDDLNIVKSSPYLKITNVHGYVFDLEHGTLQEVTT